VSTEDLIEMDFFGEGFNSVGVREVIEGRMLSERITSLKMAKDKVATKLMVDGSWEGKRV